MGSYYLIACIALRLCSLFDTAAADDALVVLTQENYTSFLENNKLVLVEFTAPWCGHCRRMGKEYENAANTLQKLKSPGRLAIIDASLKENHGIVDVAKVEGYPSFLLYRLGYHVLSYAGLRTESHFVDYMLQKSVPLLNEIDKLEDLLKFLRSHIDPLKEVSEEDSSREAHYFFIGMISPKGSGDNFEEMTASRQLMEDVSARSDKENIHFLFTDNEAIMDYFLVPEDSFHSTSIASVMMTRDNSAISTSPITAILRTDITTTTQLFNFVMTSTSETMLPFHSDNLHLLRNIYAPKNQVLVFCDAADTEGKACLQIVQKVSPLYRGTFLFVTVSHQELHLYHTFGIKIGTPHPQIVILNITDEHQLQKYVLDADAFRSMSQSDSNDKNVEEEKKEKEKIFSLTEDYLNQYLKMYLSNELLPFYRSEEISPLSTDGSDSEKQEDGSELDSDDGPSGEETEEERRMRLEQLPLRVTSATLKEMVIDRTETVLLFITAPWCGHCKSLEPVIRSLAKLLHQRKRKHEKPSSIPSLAGLPVSDEIVATTPDSGAWDDVVVAQIDGSLNDLHSLGSVDVNGFPTIVFVRYVDGKKESIEYNGERSVKDILQYIHRNGVPLTTSSSARSDDRDSSEGGSKEEL